MISSTTPFFRIRYIIKTSRQCVCARSRARISEKGESRLICHSCRVVRNFRNARNWTAAGVRRGTRYYHSRPCSSHFRSHVPYIYIPLAAAFSVYSRNIIITLLRALLLNGKLFMTRNKYLKRKYSKRVSDRPLHL